MCDSDIKTENFKIKNSLIGNSLHLFSSIAFQYFFEYGTKWYNLRYCKTELEDITTQLDDCALNLI